jgi:hypothetical protein
MQRLEATGHLVVYADTLESIDVLNAIESSDVLIALALALEQRMAALLKEGTLIPWARRFGNEIKELLFSDVALKDFKLKAGGEVAGTEIGLELKENPSFRKALRQAANDRRRQFLDQTRSYFSGAADKARQAGFPRGLVVILDNLEKLATDPEVRDSARAMFLHQADALQVPGVHLIYTLPAALVFSRSGPQLGRLYGGAEPLVLPMVKVRNADTGAAHPAGCRAMRELLLRRLDFAEVFQSHDKPVDALVRHCGGYARDLLRLAEYSLQIAGDLPVTVPHVEVAISTLRKSYLRSYSTDDLPLLRYVEKRRPKKIPEEHQARLEEVIVGHFIMIYGNGTEWYDVHPLVEQLLADEAGNHR